MKKILPSCIRNLFFKTAKKVSRISGAPISFISCVLIILLWFITGPLFNYSNTWQLLINTSTTIITFLMVFLIQNTQNRDAEAIQIKLDELIRGNKNAHNVILDLENLPLEELDKIKKLYSDLAKEARKSHHIGKKKMVQNIKFKSTYFKN